MIKYLVLHHTKLVRKNFSKAKDPFTEFTFSSAAMIAVVLADVIDFCSNIGTANKRLLVS